MIHITDLYTLRASCRVCLEIHSEMKTLLDFDKLANYRDMLISVYGMKKSGHHQPNNICIKCADKVLAAYSLKLQCEKTDLFLKGLSIDHLSLKSNHPKDKESFIVHNLDPMDSEKNIAFSEYKENEITDCSSEVANGRKSHLEGGLAGLGFFSVKCGECKICGKIFKTFDELQKHIKSHDPNKPFHCKVGKCRWSFSSEFELIAHTHVNHSGKDTHECIICSKLFRNKRCLRQHMFVHREDRRYKCRFCKKGFNFAKHLENHEVTHTKANPYLCQKCGKGFVTKDRLILHVKRHEGIKLFLCANCPKKYFSNAELTMHSNIHASDQCFICSLCGLRFTLKSSLSRHIRNIHTSMPYMCKICASVCNGRNGILKHMKKQEYSQNSGLRRGNRLQKRETLASAGKVMTTVFCHSHGVILIFKMEKTITRAYYASFLDKLKAGNTKKNCFTEKMRCNTYPHRNDTLFLV